VKSGDKLYDLGCGDGRIVITAAKSYGARGVGIDLNPERITEAKANAKEAGVEDKVSFIQQDLLKSDFSDADVVSLYLLPSVNMRLRPQLWKQLRPGTRIVSHDFDMGPDWPPEQTIQVAGSTIYRWTITDKLKRRAQ
jgi:SAM-dependent methyltransferase